MKINILLQNSVSILKRESYRLVLKSQRPTPISFEHLAVLAEDFREVQCATQSERRDRSVCAFENLKSTILKTSKHREIFLDCEKPGTSADVEACTLRPGATRPLDPLGPPAPCVLDHVSLLSTVVCIEFQPCCSVDEFSQKLV